MANKKRNYYKAQSNVEDYTYFVLKGLIGIKGSSISHIISHIIKSWIHDNHDLLEKWNLSVVDWRKEKEKEK